MARTLRRERAHPFLGIVDRGEQTRGAFVKPLIVRAFGRFFLMRIPGWLDPWLTRRMDKPGDTIKIKRHKSGEYGDKNNFCGNCKEPLETVSGVTRHVNRDTDCGYFEP